MNTRIRRVTPFKNLFAALLAAPLLAVPATVATAGSAGAAEAATCGAWQTSYQGYIGGYAWCDKGPKYRVKITCVQKGTGIPYSSYGPWVSAPKTSKTYCSNQAILLSVSRDVA